MRNPIVPIALILVAIAIFFVYVNPTYNGPIADAQSQIAGYDNALAASATYAAKENQLASERNAIPAAQLARLEQFLPDGADNVQIILDLDALAARSGLTLTDFTTSVPSQSSTPSAGTAVVSSTAAVQIDVSATGSYSAMRTFMTGIEKSLRLVDLMSLTVKEADSGVYTYQMSFRLYSLP